MNDLLKALYDKFYEPLDMTETLSVQISPERCEDFVSDGVSISV